MCAHQTFICLRTRAAAFLVILAGVSLNLACGRPLTQNFRSMHVDQKTLKVHLDAVLRGEPAPGSDYYSCLVNVTKPGRYTVEHRRAGSSYIYNYFFVEPADFLYSRDKWQVLLSGPFGTVYAHSTYFYASESPTSFAVVLYLNGSGGEPFQLLPSSPAADNLTLSGISVVRIFQAPPGFLVVSANYAPDGHLESLHVNGSKQGEWVHSNELRPLYPDVEVATMIGDRPRTRERFGLPAAFPVGLYFKPATGERPASVFRPVGLRSSMDVVNLHYDRNRWVRQDSFLPDGTRSTRFLVYTVTDEDRVLERIDNAKLFGQFPYTRTPATH